MALDLVADSFMKSVEPCCPMKYGFMNNSQILLLYQSHITLFATRPCGHKCCWAHKQARAAKNDTSRLSLVSAEYQVPDLSNVCQSPGPYSGSSAACAQPGSAPVLLCGLGLDCSEESFVGKCCEK